jgi:GTP cyclohydrolase IB
MPATTRARCPDPSVNPEPVAVCRRSTAAPELEDIQKHRDDRDIAIEQVGVTDLRDPITVLDRAAASQRTIANLTLSVGLPHHTKGTHMSRFIEVLERHRGEIRVRTLPALLADIKTTLEADSARIEVDFPYVIARSAPASGAQALMDYQCSFVAEIDRGALDFVLGVAVPVSSLCPCSKAISDYGAHNQRGTLLLEVRSKGIARTRVLVCVAQVKLRMECPAG